MLCDSGHPWDWGKECGRRFSPTVNVAPRLPWSKKVSYFFFFVAWRKSNETSLFSSLNIHDTAEVPALINLNSSFVVFLICFVDSMLLKLRISLHLFVFFPLSLQNSIKYQVSIVCYASPKGLTWANGASVGHQKASKRESCEKVCVQLFSVSSAELI